MTDRHSSPLRYPGGKSFLTDFLREVIRLNRLNDGLYVEPYAGGAGAALNLLMSEVVSEIHINDLDVRVFRFWQSVVEFPDALITKIESAKVDLEEWRRCKSVVGAPEKHSPVDVGYAFFFLNRTNRSGVSNGGPIGGIDQSGPYKINARFNKAKLIRRIERISLYGTRIKVTRLDGIELLQKYRVEWASKKAFIYLDPPYFAQGKQVYSKYFKDEDHETLAAFLNDCADLTWLASYDDASLISKLYTGTKNVILMKYVMHSFRLDRELIISSLGCKLPEDIQTDYGVKHAETSCAA